jgi:hypothetical protein
MALFGCLMAKNWLKRFACEKNHKFELAGLGHGV